MILTCPACDTKYVVKDGAIPPGGRKVRCASCKHSWHQDPDPVDTLEADEQLPNPLETISGPPEPDPDAAIPLSEPGRAEIADQFIAEVPEPDNESPGWNDAGPVDADEDVPADVSSHDISSMAGPVESDYSSDTPAYLATSEDAQADYSPQVTEDEVAADDDGYVEFRQNEPRKRSIWPWLIGALLVLAAAAAAFWFLAPPEWKNRAGIAQNGASPLQLVITSKPDRQILSSGNELVSVSGKVTNPTDGDVEVPPIQATLRNSGTKQVVHRWTIAPPAKVLAPGSSASFNSAEVDIPTGGDELTISWAGQ